MVMKTLRLDPMLTNGLTRMSDCAIMEHAKLKSTIRRARFAFIAPSTITTEIVGYSARRYRRGIANHHGCALVGLAWQRPNDSGGRCAFYPPQDAKRHCANSDALLTTASNGGADDG